MADKLDFHLVSPESELFAGPVDQVVVPGEEGDFGVLPHHAPLMSTIRPGAITVMDGSETRRIFIRGGFADVTPDGLTILAEEAVDLSEVELADLDKQLQNAREDLGDAADDKARKAAEDAIARLEAMRAAKTGAA
ncbi:MAG: F0F1 ATP synthase subunit epsilon [Caulobacterales bacterium]|nr:F0F1 ATP synthase subunit epsilon [Caulobacterales bacterium]